MFNLTSNMKWLQRRNSRFFHKVLVSFQDGSFIYIELFLFCYWFDDNIFICLIIFQSASNLSSHF